MRNSVIASSYSCNTAAAVTFVRHRMLLSRCHARRRRWFETQPADCIAARVSGPKTSLARHGGRLQFLTGISQKPDGSVMKLLLTYFMPRRKMWKSPSKGCVPQRYQVKEHGNSHPNCAITTFASEIASAAPGYFLLQVRRAAGTRCQSGRTL